MFRWEYCELLFLIIFYCNDETFSHATTTFTYDAYTKYKKFNTVRTIHDENITHTKIVENLLFFFFFFLFLMFFIIFKRKNLSFFIQTHAHESENIVKRILSFRNY